ncbi:ankyrin repeat and LEM domain-containing protein 1-like [Cimex lectularius]|uniref:LEM domain-containing protein n=1 Tax=Cimex lectularius TaxID=79782 RepID=A0A8I6S7S8_CIMLE|nr:ankyrin repeat and LEM domain-containing protein 1-like [Cimex lectularius]
MDRFSLLGKDEAYTAYCLYKCIKTQQLVLCEYLLHAKTANPNFVLEGYGIAPFHCAVGIGTEQFALQTVALCLQYGGDPNLRSSDDTTPLMIAAIWKRAEILKLLLNHGGDPSIIDHDGSSVFDYAAECGDKKVYNILLKYTSQFVTKRPKRKSRTYQGPPVIYDETRMDSEIYSTIDSDKSDISFLNENIYPANSTNFFLKRKGMHNKNEEYSDIDSGLSYVEVYAPNSTDISYDISEEIEKLKLNPPVTVCCNDKSVDVKSSTDSKEIGQTEISFTPLILTDTIIERSSVQSEDCSQIGGVSNPSYNELNERIIGSQSSLSSLSSCATDVLKFELKKNNLFVGPVLKNTKKVYLRKLKKFKKGQINIEEDDEKGLNEILALTFKRSDFILYLEKWSSIEQELVSSLDVHGVKLRRAGCEKVYFTYLLLDPTLTCNLPQSQKYLEKHEVWKLFVKAIFYVGKGKNARPHSHLYDAAKSTVGGINSAKNKRIHHIWEQNLGVVCLNVFHNLICLEAHIREAAMIDALHGANITNQQAGQYYAPASKWPLKKKRQLGVVLLHKAMNIYLAEGETQIRKCDLK